MKKLLPFLFICLLFHSCEKEYCWNCEMVSKISGNVISRLEYCNKTEEEINEIIHQISSDNICRMRCARYMK